MKKYSYILALLLGFCSCSYEYEMPDYSNAITPYEKKLLENGIEQKFREEYSKYDIEVVNFGIQEEHAIEKDASGSVIYDGDARGRANIRSKTMDISYAVNHRVKPKGGHYQDVVGYYQRSFNIDVSPFDVKAIVTNDMLTYIPKFYLVSRNGFVNVIIDKAHELGYELMDAVTYVTERDKEKKDLIRYEHDPLKGMVASQMNADYLYVEIDIYGSKKMKLGTFVFNELKLSGFDKIELTRDMQYEFVRHE